MCISSGENSISVWVLKCIPILPAKWILSSCSVVKGKNTKLETDLDKNTFLLKTNGQEQEVPFSISEFDHALVAAGGWLGICRRKILNRFIPVYANTRHYFQMTRNPMAAEKNICWKHFYCLDIPACPCWTLSCKPKGYQAAADGANSGRPENLLPPQPRKRIQIQKHSNLFAGAGRVPLQQTPNQLQWSTNPWGWADFAWTGCFFKPVEGRHHHHPFPGDLSFKEIKNEWKEKWQRQTLRQGSKKRRGLSYNGPERRSGTGRRKKRNR